MGYVMYPSIIANDTSLVHLSDRIILTCLLHAMRSISLYWWTLLTSEPIPDWIKRPMRIF